MRPDIKDQARNKWASILSHFGVDDDLLTGKHSPCPMCGGKDRFRFDNIDGRGTWICNVCGAGDGMHLLILKTGMPFKDAAQAVREMLGEASEGQPKREISPEFAAQLRRDLWLAGTPIGNDEAAAYLRSRGLNPPATNVLRYCRSAEVNGHPRNTRLAAMLALVSDAEGKPVNIHRTFLENAAKARMEEPRQMMPGKVPAGSAIRLYPHQGRLGVAEGIETAIAVYRDFRIPCWAAINSTMLSQFVPPADVTEFHIFGDNDPKFGGQAAAFKLAHRIATRPNAPLVTVHIPDIVQSDWEDIGRKRAA